MILLSLYIEDKNLSELQNLTENSSSSIVTKTKYWIEMGFIGKKGNHYSLTTPGKIITKKIINLLRCFNADQEGRIIEGKTPEPENFNAEILIASYSKSGNTISNIMLSLIAVKILFAIENSIRTRDEIKEVTGSSTPVITPKIRMLREYKLIIEDKNGYNITPSGRTLIKAIRDLIYTEEIIKKHNRYWNNHVIDDLPNFAQDRIGYLLHSRQIFDTPDHPFRNFETIMVIVSEAEYLHPITNYITPYSLTERIIDKVKEGANVESVITNEQADKIFKDPSLKRLRDSLILPNMKMYVGDIPSSFTLAVSDKCFALRCMAKDGITFDSSQGIICNSEKARQWGELVFQYYKSRSVPIMDYYKII